MKLLVSKADITRALILRAVAALEYKAHNEAGQSFGEDIFDKEETQEWEDAQVLRAALKQKLLP